ncbi:MAG: hypothetical protein A3J76_01980 [Candidatus Moranbacteria bacterium RBG_13_45_13]|nr:MAG: hypothetical protein A3J76_01980 [Candidatus Moranbacteria bacterium RBG_13_45_13]
MKNIQDNLHYFRVSQENPEPQLDLNYFVIGKEPKIKEYLKNIKEIKETLITLKKLKENEERKDVVEKYYQKLFQNLNDYSNCSELGCFVNACDTTRDLIKKDFESFKTITDFYLKKRIVDDKVPESWVQAIIDNNASRKKGKLGENKIIKILNKADYRSVNSWNHFNDRKKCVACFSKDIFDNDAVKEKLKINLKTKNQDKMLDLLIKNKKTILILEAKHLNTDGGEQNKQIDELIKILELKESNQNIFYVSFLDGTYSNKLLAESITKRSRKLLKQRKQVERYLKNKNSRNFWVNTAGFEKLISDLR